MAETNPILQMLNATPEEQAVLRRIAELREQFPGIPDEQVYALAKGSAMTIGGGYGYLPTVANLAGIQANYNLGRGNLAFNLMRDQYERAGNPYNVVSALMQGGDMGNIYGGGNAAGEIPQLEEAPRSQYADWMDRTLFTDRGGEIIDTQQNASGQYEAAPLDDATIARIRQQYATNPNAEAGFAAMARAAGGQPDTAGRLTTMPVGNAADAANVARRNASRLIASNTRGIGGLPTQFTRPLAGGGAPGFNSINQEQFSHLPIDVQRAMIGRWQGTGRFSDAGEAFDQYQKRYEPVSAGAGVRMLRG